MLVIHVIVTNLVVQTEVNIIVSFDNLYLFVRHIFSNVSSSMESFIAYAYKQNKQAYYMVWYGKAFIECIKHRSSLCFIIDLP